MKKNKNVKLLLVVGLILICVGVGIILVSNTTSPKNSSTKEISKTIAKKETSPTPTTPADFSMRLINEKGEKVTMSQFKGKVIFINVWATWCRPCIEEMPDIQSLYKKFNEDVVFLMVSKDRNFDKAIAFKERKKYDFPIFKPEGNLPSLYRSSSIPMSYIIDTKGNLVLTYTGMGDFASDDFKAYLESLIL